MESEFIKVGNRFINVTNVTMVVWTGSHHYVHLTDGDEVLVDFEEGEALMAFLDAKAFDIVDWHKKRETPVRPRPVSLTPGGD